MQNNNDEILRGFAERNEKVIESFIEKNKDNLEIYIKSNSGSQADANDIMQEAILLLLEIADKKEVIIRQDLPAFFYGVYTKLWHRKLRKVTYKKKAWLFFRKNIVEIDDHNDYFIDQMMNKSRYLLFKKHFNKLSEECKEIHNLVNMEFGIEQIAKIMNYTVKFTYKKISICKKKLIESIKKDADYDKLKFNNE